MKNNAMNRRNFLVVSEAFLGATVLPCGTRGAVRTGGKPNVILCMTDDQGWGDVGYNGHPVLKTPNLDRMSKEGLRFDRFYSGAPVCSPTRASCLTGRHPYRFGVVYANQGHMRKEEITIAEVLRDHGYATGHFGKWHLGTLTTDIRDSNRGKPGNTDHYSPPWQNGFDVCFSTESKTPTYWLEGAYKRYGTHYWTGPKEMVPPEEVSGDDSRVIMDNALDFIEDSARKREPFLAVIWFHTPHKPIVSRPPYTDGYKKNKGYYGCITAMDQQMGRLRKELRDLGIEDKTMLWFCSDNGPERGTPGSKGHFRARKRSLHEGGVRVPGLLVWPEKIRQNRVVDMPCSTSDYFPTILDALGILLPDSDRPYDGVSLLPLIEGRMEKRPKPIGFESKNQVALTGNRYKIYSDNGGRKYVMYDLVEDPEETSDVSDQHPEMFRTMKATVEKWRESCTESSEGEDY